LQPQQQLHAESLRAGTPDLTDEEEPQQEQEQQQQHARGQATAGPLRPLYSLTSASLVAGYTNGSTLLSQQSVQAHQFLDAQQQLQQQEQQQQQQQQPPHPRQQQQGMQQPVAAQQHPPGAAPFWQGQLEWPQGTAAPVLAAGQAWGWRAPEHARQLVVGCCMDWLKLAIQECNLH
jgi:hypothetical protein